MYYEVCTAVLQQASVRVYIGIMLVVGDLGCIFTPKHVRTYLAGKVLDIPSGHQQPTSSFFQVLHSASNFRLQRS